MDKVSGKLTVYFEDPFWVGVFERIEDGKLSVAKVTFGAEPKDYEVQEYIQKYYFSLKFSPAVETIVKDIKKNPKRMQREARKQTIEIGIGTKSQQALKLQQEQNKQEEIRVMTEEKKGRKTKEEETREANVSDTDTTEEEKENARKLHAVKMIEKYYTWLNEEEVGILEAMLEDCKRRKREYAIEEE